MFPQVIDQGGGGVAAYRARRWRPPWLLPLVDRLEDQRFLPGAHAFQGANPAVCSSLLEFLERADAEFAVEDGDGLRADALEMQQVQNRRWKLRQQLLVELRVSRVDDLTDARRQILADAGNLPQRGCVERREVVGVVRDDVGAVAVRANLERILALDLEQVGDLAENPRDRDVIQREAPRARSGNRAPARPRRSARRQSAVRAAGGP